MVNIRTRRVKISSDTVIYLCSRAQLFKLNVNLKNCKTDAVIIRILTDISAMLPSSGYTSLVYPLFKGRLALNPGLNLTRVSFSCVQKHFLR